MSFDPKLEIGEVITNKKLCDIFKCGNMGGMRKSNTTNTLVIVSDQTKKFYTDKWEKDILYYTGMGKKDDQELYGNQNITLYESNSNNITIHLFEVLKKGEYIYRGIAYLVKKPYQNIQKDIDGNDRKVWIFPLKLVNKRINSQKSSDEIRINEEIENLFINQELNSGSFTIPDFSKYNKKRRHKKRKKQGNYNIYIRDKKIFLNALAMANFKCEINDEHKLFVRKNMDVFYTEPHHLVPMEYSDQFDVSLDVEENIVSLCSHCHNEIHYGRDRLKLLKKLYDERKDLLKEVGIELTFSELKMMYK